LTLIISSTILLRDASEFIGEPAVKTRLLVLMALIALSGPVMAGETENIQSCIKAIKDNTGKLADEFDVQYESHLIAFDIARWPGIDCEVMLGEVQNLAVDGKTFIVEASFV